MKCFAHNIFTFTSTSLTLVSFVFVVDHLRFALIVNPHNSFFKKSYHYKNPKSTQPSLLILKPCSNPSHGVRPWETRHYHFTFPCFPLSAPALPTIIHPSLLRYSQTSTGQLVSYQSMQNLKLHQHLPSYDPRPRLQLHE